MSKQGHVTYSEVFKFLSNKSSKYADECSESRKRAIRRFSEKVALEDGLLFYLQFCDKDKKEVKRKKQWINDHQKQQQILQSLHDDPTGGCHFGRDKTREKLANRFYWPTMYEDVDNYVKTCERCQKVLTYSYWVMS